MFQRARLLVASVVLPIFVACGGGSAGTTSTGGGGGSSSSNGSTSSATSSSQGSGGASSSSSGTGTGAGPASGSQGCGTASADPTAQWVAKTADVSGVTRDYFVRLPAGYDETRAYPVIYQFHGCSSSAQKENNNVPVEQSSGPDAIIVRGRAVDDCWDASKSSPDVLFFDAMVAATEAAYCADTSRRFVAGYSSGAFMTHLLSCVRGDKIRGVASIAGGQGGSQCTGKVAALLIHDENDTTVQISASEAARDRYLSENGCGDTTAPFDPSPCVAYDGCDPALPVVWCQTSGKNHDRQDGFAGPAFWGFLSKL